MKRIVFVLGFVLLSIATFSQSKNAFGIKGGANISSLSNANMEYKTHMYFGVFLNIPLTSFYQIQPELLYNNQGGKNNENGTLNISYISAGVANNFFINKNVYFSLTPSLDFDVDDTFIGLANRHEDEEGNDITFIDLSASIGIGYQFKNGLGIEGRYKQGFIDVYSGNFHDFDSYLYEEKHQFNSVFQIGLSYTFKTLKKEK